MNHLSIRLSAPKQLPKEGERAEIGIIHIQRATLSIALALSNGLWWVVVDEETMNTEGYPDPFQALYEAHRVALDAAEKYAVRLVKDFAEKVGYREVTG